MNVFLDSLPLKNGKKLLIWSYLKMLRIVFMTLVLKKSFRFLRIFSKIVRHYL